MLVEVYNVVIDLPYSITVVFKEQTFESSINNGISILT